jgi:peptidoglycan/xylan/chitin deacetylase (PgdA/CDA1 family)
MTSSNGSIARMLAGLVLAALATWPARSVAGDTPGVVAAAATPSPAVVDRRIAITFDDLPWVMLRDAPPADLAAEQARLIASLKQAGVPVIGFVNEGLLYAGDALQPQRVQMLEDWLDAGFELGNHTRWHSDLNAVGAPAFETGILDGERILRPMLARRGLTPQWFRYPYLRTGTTLEEKTEVEAFLAGHGYRIAPVTINSSEWVFALAYRRAIAAQATNETLQKLRDGYITYMLAELAYYERHSLALLGHDIPQVILLHASELNADTCTDLLAAIRARGYRFVTLADATADPAYRLDDTYTGALGTSWIFRWAKTQGRPDTFYFGEPQTPQWVVDLAGVSLPVE